MRSKGNMKTLMASRVGTCGSLEEARTAVQCDRQLTVLCMRHGLAERKTLLLYYILQ